MSPVLLSHRAPLPAGLLMLLVASCSTGEAPPTVSLDRPNVMLPALTSDEQHLFRRGDELFEVEFREADGLGPRYIRASCEACHAGDARGPGQVMRKLSGSRANESQLRYAGVVRPYAIEGTEPPALPSTEEVTTLRLPPAVFGRGAMEAVRSDAIEKLAERAAQRPGPIKGRIHRVVFPSHPNPDQRYHRFEHNQANLIGRFGLKARSPSVDDFVADALQGDMGLTSPLRPTEPQVTEGETDDKKPGVDVSVEDVNALSDYVRLLQIPERATPSRKGKTLFEQVQCAECHVPELPTREDYPVAELAGKTVALFTDFLLHDMGSGLTDHVEEGDAKGSEWRTAPLIGLRFFSGYLHDGRAHTVRDAIAGHASPDSEANDSVQRFEALSAEDQKTLLHFVESL